MPLFEQKYPNNIRTITGLLNPVFPDDVTLLCDTSAGAVNIQLQGIPYQVPFPLATPNQYVGYYNTQYQLYVVDYSSNSAVNNITITAPVGFTINGQPSVTLSSNGASYLIVIGSQTNYLALYGGQISGMNPLLISLTNAQLLNLIATNTIVAGQFYLVTDALGTDGGVVLQGDAINGSSVNGTGLYYNADYQAVGNYSGVVGFTSNVGIWWNPPPAPVPFGAGSVVIYDNLHYVNLTNVWGVLSPPLDGANWQLIPKSPTGGYIRACDQVRYNVQTNRVVYRADKQGNEVDWFNNGVNDSIADFQWGRNQVTNNKVLSNSYMACTNSYAVFNANELTNGSSISDSTPFVLGGGGSVARNVLKNSSTISSSAIINSVQMNDNHLDTGSSIVTGVIVTTTINNNKLYTNGNITISNSNILVFDNNLLSANGSFVIDNNLGASSVTYCEVSDITARYRGLNEILSHKKCRTGFSNFAFTIDCLQLPVAGSNSGFIPAPTNTLVIDLVYDQHYGLISLSRFNVANTTLKISNLTTNHPITFFPDFAGGGSNPTFATTAVGVAGLDDIVSSSVAPPPQFTLNTPDDSITIERRRAIGYNIVTDFNDLV